MLQRAPGCQARAQRILHISHHNTLRIVKYPKHSVNTCQRACLGEAAKKRRRDARSAKGDKLLITVKTFTCVACVSGVPRHNK